MARRKAKRAKFQASPVMFQNKPILFVFLCVLCLVLIGIPLLLIWYLDCKGTVIAVTEERTILRRGIQVKQSAIQRMFGVGDVGISCAAFSSPTKSNP